jgi:hypothetical protein
VRSQGTPEEKRIVKLNSAIHVMTGNNKGNEITINVTGNGMSRGGLESIEVPRAALG